MISELNLGIIIGAALLDSINPCVFGVLIFLITYLMNVYKNPNRMLLAGSVYVIVVYVTYFAIGLGIVQAAGSAGLTNAFYWFAAIIAIIAGLLELKDFFWYGRGFSLQMLPGADKRIKLYTAKIGEMEKRHPLLGLLVTAFLAVFVVLVELPCTGAPYLAILALISEGAFAQAVPLLALYNLVFIAPLLVIIALAYFGKSSSAMEDWRKKNRKLMRLAVGVFLIGLGLYMIYSIT